jgi:CarD family transcriptional regulator
MATNESPVVSGDLVVHKHHGVAEVVMQETKTISGEAKTYYKLRMSGFTLWATPEQLESDMYRPVIGEQRLTKVKEVLQRPAKKMSNHFISRKARMQRVLKENNLVEVARLVRDLRQRRLDKRDLNQTEEFSLRDATNCLIEEWSAAAGISESTARKRMDKLLRKSQADISA